jgi:hypothetical protein
MVDAKDAVPMTYGYLWKLQDEIDGLKKEVAALKAENDRLNRVQAPGPTEASWVTEWKKEMAARGKHYA